MVTTTAPMQRNQEQEYADAMLVEVLTEVAAIEAEIIAAAEAGAAASGSGSVAADVDELLSNVLSHATDASGDDAIAVEEVLLSTPSPETTLAVGKAHENHVDPVADPFERWDPNGLRFPSDATDIAAVALRHHNHNLHHFDHVNDDPPLLSILPAVGACVLLFVLATWSQLRRSRRRAMELHDDWMRDMDLMESAYTNQAGPAGYLL